ncbi:MAG: choice-of-anchor D domain-containing protein [Candidatus Binataceae bacterium]
MRIVPMHPAVPKGLAQKTSASSSEFAGSRDEPEQLAFSQAEAPDVLAGGFESFAPSDAYTFYDETPLLNAGIKGATGSDCIAIYGDSDVTSNPLNAFTSQFMNGTTVNLTRVNADGATEGKFSGDEIEALLDIEWSHAIAPSAPIYLYLDQDIGDAVNHVATDNKCGTVNISFGICGAQNSYYTGTLDPIFSKAASQGISIFISAGDSGADACGLGTANVSEMSADTNVVSVGGTQFNPDYNGSGNDVGFVAESVWNDDSGATGGGVSQVFSKPIFQEGVPGVPAGNFRSVPDVAMMASPNSPGVLIYNDGNCSGGGACGTNVATLTQIGGTSLSAPVWSGISKLIMQENGGTRIGNPDSRIYSLANSSQSGNGFRDVTTGNNSVEHVTGYSAAPGYDAVSGWGTVDMNTFVTAFASSTAEPTPTATPTSSSSATPTPTPAPTPTSAPTHTATPAPTRTATPTPTPMPTPTVPAALTVSPGVVSFGNVKIGAVKQKKVTLTNSSAKGGSTITLQTANLPSGTEFFFNGSSCTGALGPKQKCTVTVGFAPTLPGSQSAPATISDNASNGPQTFGVVGVGVARNTRR